MALKLTKKTILAGVVALALIGASGYYFQQRTAIASAPQGGAGQPPQAMPVTVENVAKEPIQIWSSYSARLEGVDFAEIRPQVSGTISEVKFEDGQDVKEGDVLFVIDPRPYEAAVKQAEAEANAVSKEASLAQKELKRARELIKTDAISKRILDERASAASVGWASVEAAKARLERAKIDLDYAFVKAPISGRTSRVEIKVGNLVEAGPSAPMLTSIVSTEGIYADFEVDEQTYLRYVRSNARDRDAENKIPVKLTLSGDAIEYEGFIHSFDNQIDVSSGTIRARAHFANEDGALLPGMFANVKMGSPNTNEQIVLTERAIGTDQDRKFVYVVNADSMVEYRAVTIGESIKGKRVITSGLNEGDTVITDGIIRLRPGMPVAPQAQQEAKLTEAE